MKELEKRIEDLELALELQSSVNNSMLKTNETLYEMILNISDRIDVVKKTMDSSLDIMSGIVTDKIIN
jgi:hypothetical protein